MTGVRNSLNRTQFDAIAEVVSAESFHIVLETNPPEYVEKISHYLESCVGQSGQEKVSNGAAEADSDSGDSLFITQKPVPEAERSGRRRTYSSRSKPVSPRDLEESEEDTSSSTSHDEESKTDKKRRRIKKYKLPEYNFPFLPERKLKLRSTGLPDQNKNLLNYTMGGFFKCVGELRLKPKSSLPTVDTDGEDISPLSEEDEDGSDVEDIKVVERKRLVEIVSPSKAKRQQARSTRLKQQRKRKTSNVGQGTSRGRQTKMLHKDTVKASESKVVAVSSVTESSDNGESSCRALVQSERKDQHATSDGNFLAQTETPKRKGCLVRGDALSLRKASEEDSEATVCELPIRQSTQNGREASTPVPEPQTDAGNETKEKKRKEKKKDKEHHESAEEGKGQSQEEPDNVLRQEEGDIPNSKQKKKKRKKDKSAAENVGQEVDGSLESDVRVEDSNMEDGGKEEKKKKKKRKRSGEDVEQLQSGAAVAEPLNDNTEIQKKKKKKRRKEEMIVITEEREEEEAANRTLGSPQMSTEQLEESGNCLEDAAASQETLDSSYVKRKKHKKKRQSSSNDATQDGEEGEDMSVCLDDSVTLAKGTSLKQKKKKTIFERVNSSNTPDENEKVNNTQEGLEDQNAELVTKKKKKKKKKSEIFSRDISEDKVAQSDDSVSVRKKKKERTSSFLVADVEENDARAHGEAEKPDVSAGDLEELNGGVMKKKRKMSVAQDSVDKDHEQDFEEPKKSTLSETTDTKVKKKKKRTGSGSEEERLEADVGLSPTEEAVVLKKKKKKKKKCKDEQEGPPTASEDVESVALNSCSSISHKKKGEHGRSAEISHDSSTTSDRASEETLNAVELGNQALTDSRDKKKKKKRKSTDNVLLEGNSLTESAELEHREIKKKERNKQSAVPRIISETPLSKFETSSSDNIMKNKHKKVKRLHNPSEDFLSDC